jgi:hypothetical protein
MARSALTLWWVGLSWIAGPFLILWIVGPAIINTRPLIPEAHIANPYAATTIQRTLFVFTETDEDGRSTIHSCWKHQHPG